MTSISFIDYFMTLIPIKLIKVELKKGLIAGSPKNRSPPKMYKLDTGLVLSSNKDMNTFAFSYCAYVSLIIANELRFR